MVAERSETEWALATEAKMLRAEVKGLRKLLWLVLDAAGGQVTVSDVARMAVGPHDACEVEAVEDTRNRCMVVRRL